MSEYSDRIKRAKELGLYKVADLEGGKEVTHTISHLLENVMKFEREMDLLCFSDTARQLPLNITNGDWLIQNFGDDPAQWGGNRVTLHLAPYGKENKLGIRLKKPNGSAEPEDSIPF